MSGNEDLCQLSAAELAAQIADRGISPVEIVEAVLSRIDRLQPVFNCFVTIRAEAAREAAKAAERAVLRGDRLGLLHGVPYSVKDIVNTAGVRTTFGSLFHEHNVPDEDAVAAARLKQHGGVLVGKTTTPEFGAKALTDAPLFGRTRNAWSPERTSGGSSGGAAVAVALGMGPIGIATDGGGSTRIPAACNGVVGLKQSLGVVPHSQVQDAFGNYTYVTPMTRTVADTALMLQAMAGPDPSDPWSAEIPVPDYIASARPEGDLRGKRVLSCAAPAGRPVSKSVADAFTSALRRLEEMGAVVEEMPGDGFDIEPIWRVINHTTWRARFGEMAAREPGRMSPSLLRQLALAADFSGIDYQQAMFDRAALFRRVQKLFAVADLIATPTLSRTALPIEQDLFAPIEIDGTRYDELRPNWFPWTMPFNLTGHPAVSLPCGFDEQGLPIGLQLVGRFRQDAALIRAAALFEASHDLLSRWPDETRR